MYFGRRGGADCRFVDGSGVSATCFASTRVFVCIAIGIVSNSSRFDTLSFPRHRNTGRLVSALAENIDCPLAALVSETADTLLDYSDVHHRLAHETTPDDESHDVLATLMAEDALKVLQWMDRANPRLKRELSDQRFTSRTYDHERDDPRKHPVVAFLRALLLTGNLAEGSKLCRALQDCAGIHIETERYCWYLLFDKMQETQVLLEHDWDVPRRTVVPVVDRRGNVVARDFGDVTLANILIGPLGRTAALEYLHKIVLMAKDELFPGFDLGRGRASKWLFLR